MPPKTDPIPVTPADVIPYLRAILDESRNAQAAMRELEAFWAATVDGGRVSRSDPTWRPVFDLIDAFSLYEPNPQFCDPGAGMYDHTGLRQLVNDTLALIGRSGGT
jgi:hypothetical protein